MKDEVLAKIDDILMFIIDHLTSGQGDSKIDNIKDLMQCKNYKDMLDNLLELRTSIGLSMKANNKHSGLTEQDFTILKEFIKTCQ